MPLAELTDWQPEGQRTSSRSLTIKVPYLRTFGMKL